MSKTYLDRKRPSGAFALMSYSHRDIDALEKTFTALNEKGADFWYDKEMHKGEKWFEQVKEITADKNCVGIIYFVSAEFVYSDACFKEVELLDELKKTHDKFNALFVLVHEAEGAHGFSKFMENADALLKKTHTGELRKINGCIDRMYDVLDPSVLYSEMSKPEAEDDEIVDKLFDDTFKKWGCASEETGTIETLRRDGLTDDGYRVKTDSKIATDILRWKSAEWKVFAYGGDTLSAMLVTDEPVAETCLSQADDALDLLNANINKLKSGADERSKSDGVAASKKEKYFVFEEPFLQCLKRDDNGRVLRYLRASERQKYYLQLKEALEKTPVADSSDDGYFFVTDNKNRIMFSDRGSSDVYRHVHIDAYASVYPVIDIDYVKYRSYVLEKRKA